MQDIVPRQIEVADELSMSSGRVMSYTYESWLPYVLAHIRLRSTNGRAISLT